MPSNYATMLTDGGGKKTKTSPYFISNGVQQLDDLDKYINTPGKTASPFPTAGVGSVLADDTPTTAQVQEQIDAIYQPTTPTSPTTQPTPQPSTPTVTPSVSNEEQIRNAYLANLQNQYNANVSAVNRAVDAQKGALGTNYQDTLSQLLGSLTQQKDVIGQEAEQSAQDAYINRRLTERDLGQSLSARGLTGGVSESTLAGLKNQAANERNAIQVAQQQALADLGTQYGSSLSQAQQNYNTALANLEAERQSNLLGLNQSLQQGSSGVLDDFSSITADYSNVGTPIANYAYAGPTGVQTTSQQQLSQTVETNPLRTLLDAGKNRTQAIMELSGSGQYTPDQLAQFILAL